MFVRVNSHQCTYVLVYIDDILITWSSKDAIPFLVDQLNMEFALKDLGNLSYFLGIQVKHLENGSLHLSQTKYIEDLLEKAKMQKARRISTPMASNTKLSKFEGEILENSQL